MKKKFFIKNFGCKINNIDSNFISNFLENKNFIKINFFKNSNIILINTCYVRNKSFLKFINFIKKHKKKTIYIVWMYYKYFTNLFNKKFKINKYNNRF